MTGAKLSVNLPYDGEQMKQRICWIIARLDKQISQQLTEVLHHSAFQTLEASWRNLHYLVRQKHGKRNAKIVVLNISWQTLNDDLLYALDYEHSCIFNKIYNYGFGIAGGEPIDVIIGDYEFSINLDHIHLLQLISKVAAASFAPFIAGASPELLGLNTFGELGRQPDLDNIFKQDEYLAWQALRAHDDSRFIALTLPHHLLRQPYSKIGSRAQRFKFQEHQSYKGYLWGNACYAVAAVLLRSFNQTGWFASISGLDDTQQTGGILPSVFIEDKQNRMSHIMRTNVAITETQEKQLMLLGLMPVCVRYGETQAVINNYAMVAPPKVVGHAMTSANYQLSSMLQYILCACRFAHYIKIIGRDMIGTVSSVMSCKKKLDNWLLGYIAGNTYIGINNRTNYPLQGAKIEMQASIEDPTHYICQVYIVPCFHLDQILAEFTFSTEL